MKKLMLLLPFIFLFSCTSVRKLIEQGRYDEALYYSIKKVQGKKHKKRKYVEAIEKAFAKVTKKDMSEIAFLKKERNGANWDKIYNILLRIDKRQKRIEPLLPLVSKDGYRAKFKFVNVAPLIIEAKKEAADYHYQKALGYLKRAEKGDKYAARRAYDELNKIGKYYANYKDVEFLKSKAYELGQDRVLITVRNRSGMILPKRFFEELKNINTSALNDKWIKFYTDEDNYNGNYDYIVNLNISEILISPEREKEREYEEKKRIKDGYVYKKDANGKEVLDSTGHKIKVYKYKEVRALVHELYRTKQVHVRGDLKIKDMHNRTIKKSVPVNVDAVFESYACRYTGDKRALSKETRRHLKKYPEPFPSNEEMILMAVDDLKKILLSELKKK